MKIEEAIELIESIEYGNDEELCDASIEIIKTALEKQIPKELEGPYCQTCYAIIPSTPVKYCCWCGQALEWS